MKRLMRILTLLAVMMMTAGQMWARGGDVYVNTGTVEGGTLTFYKTYKDNMVDNNNTFAMRGETVYIEATPDVVHTVTGMTATNFTVVKSGGTNIAQARRRSGSNNPSAGVTITVTQVMDGETPIPGVFCFTMPDDGANVFVSATFPDKDCAENVAYIDKNGEEQSVAKAYILTGSETVLGVDGHETWYVCNSSLSYPSELTLKGDVNLIIADDCTMTVSSISGDNGDDDYDLAIHGQAPANGDYKPGNCKLISNNGLNDFGSFTVNSGSVTAFGIDASNITINGGQVNSGGPLYASSITLGWNNANDFIKAPSYSGTVKMADDKVMEYTDGDNNTVKLMGTISATDLAAIDGQKLTPYGIGGYCGQNLTWDIPLVEDALSTTMTIEGTGDMADYTNSDTPWKDYTVNLILVANEDAYNDYTSKLSDDDKAKLAPQYMEMVVGGKTDDNGVVWNSYCHNYPVVYKCEYKEGATDPVTDFAYPIHGIDTSNGVISAKLGSADGYVRPYLPYIIGTQVSSGLSNEQIYGAIYFKAAVDKSFGKPDDNDNTNYTWAKNDDGTGYDHVVLKNGAEQTTFAGNDDNYRFIGNFSNKDNTQQNGAANFNPVENEGEFLSFTSLAEGWAAYILKDGKFVFVDTDEALAPHRCALFVKTSAIGGEVLATIGISGATSTSVAKNLMTIANHGTLTVYSSYDNGILSDKITDPNANLDEGTYYVECTPSFGYTEKNLHIMAQQSASSNGLTRSLSPENTPQVGPQVGENITLTKVCTGLYSFNMPNGIHVTISADFPQRPMNTEAISYIDENGETQTKAKGTVYILDGTETSLGGATEIDTETGNPVAIPTWYVCNTAADTDHPNGLAYDDGLTLAGDVHLILADGATMTVPYVLGTSEEVMIAVQMGSAAATADDFYNLSTYGQGGQSGQLTSNFVFTGNVDISGGTLSLEHLWSMTNVNIYNGSVTVAPTTEQIPYGIAAHDVNISGGQVTAIGFLAGIYTPSGEDPGDSPTMGFGLSHTDQGSVTLGWTDVNSDFISVSEFDGGPVSIATGKSFVPYTIDDETITAGDIIASGEVSDLTTINGKELKPYMGTIVTKDVSGYSVTVNEGSGSGAVIDGSVLDANGEVTVANLDYDRTLTAPGSGEGDVTIGGQAAKLYTTCLPTTPTANANVKYYTLASVSDNTLHFTEVTSPAADTPYLMAVTGSSNVSEDVNANNVTLKKTVTSTPVDGYTMMGTQTGLTNGDAFSVSGAAYTYILQSGGNWGKVTANNTSVYIPPFRAYIVGPAPSAARQLDSSFDDATGIDSIRTIDGDGTERWYDLNGRRIDRPTQKGVYIRNGKKIAQSRRER